MSNRRVLLFCWLAIAAILWKVFAEALGYGFGAAGIANPTIGGAVDATALIAIAAAVGVAMALWKRKDVYDFCYETVDETRKVVWPNRKETRDNTVVVIICSVIMALVLGGFDLVWAKLSNFILTGA
jgi:preprotein translocase subunit SecE